MVNKEGFNYCEEVFSRACFEEDVNNISAEREILQKNFQQVLLARTKPEDYILESGSKEEFLEKISDAANEMSEKDFFASYFEDGLLPSDDVRGVYAQISSLLSGHKETKTDVFENIHHEVFVRFRMMGKSGTQYREFIEGLGIDELLFEGDALTPETVNYNRSLIIEKFDSFR